jgi:hypothetical protein
MLALILVGCVPAFVFAATYEVVAGEEGSGSCSYSGFLPIYVAQFVLASVCGMWLNARLSKLAEAMTTTATGAGAGGELLHTVAAKQALSMDAWYVLNSSCAALIGA